MYAVITTGGKQYLTSKDDVVRVERLSGNVGSKIVFDKVLMTGGDDIPKIGRPYLEGATVEAEILNHDKAKKILVFKKKKRKGYKKIRGHRQCFTEVKVTRVG